MVVGAIKKGGDAAMGPLIKAMDALKNQVQIAIGFADNAQKASLALGQTYEQTRNSLGSTMQGLRGDLNQKFSAGIAGMEAGLQGNTAGVAKLINQQQLTGTAHRATAKAMAGLESGMNLSRQDTNLLSDNLINTGAEWQISTDKLVGAIDALKSTFPAQKLAGMGANVMEAVTLLQAELGPSLADPLNTVMKIFFDSSQEGMATINKLGLAGVREQLSSDQSTRESLSILRDAIGTGSDTFKRFTVGSDKNFRLVGVAGETLSQGAIHFTTLMDAFGDRVKNEDPARDFGLTLDNLKREALVPFQEGLTLAYPFLVKLADVLSGVANIIGQKFLAFTEGLGDGGEALKNLQLAIIDFSVMAIGNLKSTFAFIGVLITDGVPYVIDKVQGAFYELYRDGGVLTQLRSSVHTLMAAINEASTWFLSGDSDDAAQHRAMVHQAKAQLLDKEIYNERKNTYENMKAGLVGSKDTTSPLGMIIKKAADAQTAALKNDPTIKALNKARESIVDGNGFARETNDILEKANKNLDDMNDKTPEPGTNRFLGDTAIMLSENLESILGIGADTTSSEMLEELRIANEQRAAQEASSPLSKTQNSI